MSDLIDRQAAIDLVRDVCNAILNECSCHYNSEVKAEVFDDIHEVRTILKCNKEIRKSLKDLPPAPEIVLCKDCRWGREVCGNIECFADSNIPPEYHDYEWFCPNGERKK